MCNACTRIRAPCILRVKIHSSTTHIEVQKFFAVCGSAIYFLVCTPQHVQSVPAGLVSILLFHILLRNAGKSRLVEYLQQCHQKYKLIQLQIALCNDVTYAEGC